KPPASEAADRQAVAGSEGAVGDGDVAGAASAEGDVVVAVGDAAVFDQHVNAGAIDAVGVGRAVGGIDGDAVDGDVGVDELEGEVNVGGVDHRDARHRDGCTTGEGDEARAGRRQLVVAVCAPPRRALAIDGAGSGDFNVIESLRVDEARIAGCAV